MRALAACVAVLLAAALAAGVESGRACSCALPDPRAALARADGAFVGVLESRRESGQEAVLVFRVERRLKGAMGGVVTVVTASNSAACGIELAQGARVGLVLERMGGAWHGSLCAQFEPAELLAAALPLPAPNGRGPVALVVGGELGDVRLIALDANGRTLAYGRGDGRPLLASFCPGNGRLVEIASVPSGYVLVLRHARTLRVVRRHTLRLPGERYPQRLACSDQAGTRVVVFARGPRGDSPARSALYRVRGGRPTAVWSGAAFDAAFTPTHAFLSAGARGRVLARVDLATGSDRSIATLPHPTTVLAVDETGTRVAGVHPRLDRSADVIRLDLRGGRAQVATARLPAQEGVAEAFWLSGGRLLFTPVYGSTARVLGPSLRTRSRFRWRALSAAVVGQRLYGTDLSLSLFRADLPDGPQRVARRLPGRTVLLASATG
jgi:hypothetical protein